MRLTRILCMLLAAACSHGPRRTLEIGTPALTPEHGDVHSYARPDEARMTHLELDLDVDFSQRRLRGTAAITIQRAPGVSQLLLDAKGLTIEAVTDQTGADLAFTLWPEDPLLGSALAIELGDHTEVALLRYTTGPGATALQWLTPEQTAGRKQPFLFSQSQAILARTWIPLQDSPGIRFTYAARIHAPAGLRAVMSAAHVGPSEGVPTERGLAFSFVMQEPIPAYLLALAVGELAVRPLGPRSAVYAEPSVVDDAAFEFADTERMLELAEKLYGPYRWGRYDLLVLPPSFPFGGMENPRLTFVSPTVLAGDRSLVSLIAHELAHSWSGNLVTNATWSDFWLNEGTTVYFEGRIIEALYGKDRAELDDVLGWQELQAELDDMGDGADTSRLWRGMKAGEDPDDGVNSVPYVKGATFLRHLERHVGRERFDAFLRSYFDTHAFTSMTTARFLELVRRDLLAGDASAASALRLDAWAYEPGIVQGFEPPRSRLLERLEELARAISAGASPKNVETKTLSAAEWVYLLRGLPRVLSAERLRELDAAWALSRSKNAEIRFEWLRLAVQNQLPSALSSLEDYLVRQGRRKLVVPLYELLAETPWGRGIAREIYEKARPGYHPLTAASIDEALATPPLEAPKS